MSENINHNTSGELTLKDLINLILEYWRDIWKNKWWIILCGLAIAVYMGVKAKMEKPTYSATLTFMVNDDDSGGASGINAILGQFGLGGGGGKSKHNLDKILQLSKTRKISQNALFSNVDVNGKSDYLANHIISYRESIGRWANKPFYKFWAEDSPLIGYKFQTDSIKNFEILDKFALRAVHSTVAGGPNRPGMVSTGYSEETGIMFLTTTSGSPQLSIELSKIMFNALKDYYISKTIEKQKFTYDLVKMKTDSIEIDLRNNEAILAKLKDSQMSKYLNKDQLREFRLEGKIRMGYAALAKAKENLEIADFSLKNKTPFIQVIDEPMDPITPRIPSLLKAIIIGMFIGCLLSVIFFVARKILRDTMS